MIMRFCDRCECSVDGYSYHSNVRLVSSDNNSSFQLEWHGPFGDRAEVYCNSCFKTIEDAFNNWKVKTV